MTLSRSCRVVRVATAAGMLACLAVRPVAVTAQTTPTLKAAAWDAEMQDLSDWIGRHPEVGFEETGWMTRDVPGVGISVWSSNSSNHMYEMTADNYNEVGHTAFRLDAQIAAALLFDQYFAGLRAAYGPEMGR